MSDTDEVWTPVGDGYEVTEAALARESEALAAMAEDLGGAAGTPPDAPAQFDTEGGRLAVRFDFGGGREAGLSFGAGEWRRPV